MGEIFAMVALEALKALQGLLRLNDLLVKSG